MRIDTVTLVRARDRVGVRHTEAIYSYTICHTIPLTVVISVSLFPRDSYWTSLFSITGLHFFQLLYFIVFNYCTSLLSIAVLHCCQLLDFIVVTCWTSLLSIAVLHCFQLLHCFQVRTSLFSICWTSFFQLLNSLLFNQCYMMNTWSCG